MHNKLVDWWQRTTQRGKKYSYQVVEDIPKRPEKNVVYLVSHLGYCWQVVMMCPCGCKKLLYMNAMPEYHPCWKYTIDKNERISLSPSIHRMVGCKSHFFVRNGRIDWCRPGK